MEQGPVLGFLCSSASWGGLEINFFRLARWMQERGWPIHIYTLAETPLAQAAQQAGLPYTLLPPFRKYYDLSAAWNLRRELKRQQVGALFLSHNRDMSLAASVKTLMGTQILTLFQQQMQMGLAKRDLLHTLRFRQMDRWLSPLDWLVEQMRQQTRLPYQHLRKVPLGVEVDTFAQPGISRAEARAFFQIDAQAPLIGLIGRIDPGKGQDFLIECLPHLPEWQALIVGEPTRNEARAQAYEQQLHERVQALGLAERVHFRPFLPQPERFFPALDAYCMASVAETYGMVTVEALSAGIPVVGAAVGGTVELLGQGERGWLFPLGDTQAFVAQVQALQHNPQERQHKVEKGFQAARDLYSHTRQCELIETILQEAGFTKP